MTEYILIVGVLSIGLVATVDSFRGTADGALEAMSTTFSRPLAPTLGRSTQRPRFSSNGPGRPATLVTSPALLTGATGSAAAEPAPSWSLDISVGTAPTERIDGSRIPPGSLTYRVYYGTSPGVYDHQINVGVARQFRIENLEADTVYYLVITAVGADGAESAPSPETTGTTTLNTGV